MRYGLEDEADQCVAQRRHSRQEGGRRMGLVSIKLLGQSFSRKAGDSLPGARPASSTTRRPCSGGQAGIICSTRYHLILTLRMGGYLSGAALGEPLSLGLARKGDNKPAQPTQIDSSAYSYHFPKIILTLCETVDGELLSENT